MPRKGGKISRQHGLIKRAANIEGSGITSGQLAKRIKDGGKKGYKAKMQQAKQTPRQGKTGDGNIIASKIT